MGNFYAFHKSVKGYLHEMKGIPREDNSGSFADEDGQYYIAVVADGHGDAACMRSADGSEIVVQVVVGNTDGSKMASQTANNNDGLLKEFADTVLDRKAEGSGRIIREQLEKGQYRDVLKPLTDSIVAEWAKKVRDELDFRPLTEEELSRAGSYADAYSNGEKDEKDKKLLHVYGTTLLAALLLPDYLILLQQGDGRCVVFYEDGEIEEPIQLDERCHENVTTSLCDEDAPLSLLKHSVVLPLKDKKVMACWLGCDGVEDSYRNTEGTYTFYRKLICELSKRKKGGFDRKKFEEDYLGEYLKEFSKMGSGDDVSVGGIVNMDCIDAFAPSFALQVEAYELQEDLERLNNKQLSMTRKHGLLQKQAEEKKSIFQQKAEVYKTTGAPNDHQKAEDAWAEYEKAADAFRAYHGDYQKIQEQMNEIKKKLLECEKQSSLLKENAKKKRELEKQMTKAELPVQSGFEKQGSPKMIEKPKEEKGMTSGAVAESFGILNRKVNQKVGITLLVITLILAFIVLLLSVRHMGNTEIITSGQFREVFGRIWEK